MLSSYHGNAKILCSCFCKYVKNSHQQYQWFFNYGSLTAFASGNSKNGSQDRKGKEMFYLTTHSTHFIYGYMVSDIWLRTILIVRKETCCCHIGYSFRLTVRVLLYAPSHRQDSTYHSLCYTSHGALAGMSNSSIGSPHEGSIRRPIAPWANALTTELHLAPRSQDRWIQVCNVFWHGSHLVEDIWAYAPPPLKLSFNLWPTWPMLVRCS